MIILNGQYIYPQDLKAEAKLWLWGLKDVVILGTALIISIVALAKVRLFLPLACTLVFAFLTIKPDDRTVLDFIKAAAMYFILSQQTYYWQESSTGLHGEEMKL